MLDLLVVGGGISGLSLAYQARLKGLNVKLLEGMPRLGGCLQTVTLSDGSKVEFGPDSLVTKPATLALLDQLKFSDEGISAQGGLPAIARQGRLLPLPDGFRALTPTRLWPFVTSRLLSWPGKLRSLAELAVPRSSRQDESLADFVRRRFGKEFLERFAQPLMSGIYAADPARLSMKATFPHLLELEKSGRSIILGGLRKLPGSGPQMNSLPRGLGQIVDALRLSLGERCETSCRADRISPGPGFWEAWAGGRRWNARQIVLAASSAELVPLTSSFSSEIALRLSNIRCRSVAVVNLGLTGKQLSRRPQSFLVPLVEGGCLTAVSSMSAKWPHLSHREQWILRLHLGGAGREGFLDLDDESLVSRALKDLQAYLPWHGEPTFCLLNRHHAKMPEYDLGHRQKIQELERLCLQFDGLWLAGNWLSGVGIGDCLARSNHVVEQIQARRTRELCKV